jgi:hypothetical protein
MDERERRPDPTGGLNEAALAEHEREDLGGAGGTQSGVPGDRLGGESPMGAGSASLGRKAGGIAAEAAALGDAPGALADEAAKAEPGAERLSGGPSGAEAIGAGAGRRDTGSLTPGDKGDLGGGDTGRSPTGTASAGGEGRA